MRVLGALLAVTLAACSGAPAASGPPSAGSAAAVTITGNFAFDPATITVSRGATVTWTNSGGTTHTITSGTPETPTNKFNQALENGKTFSVTFTETGTFTYFCSIHQTMRGTVIVR